MRKFLATRKASSKVGAVDRAVPCSMLVWRQGRISLASPGGAADPPIIHEITSLHFRAAALPRSLAPRRGALSDANADGNTGVASKTHRPGEAFGKAVPHAFRQASPIR